MSKNVREITLFGLSTVHGVCRMVALCACFNCVQGYQKKSGKAVKFLLLCAEHWYTREGVEPILVFWFFVIVTAKMTTPSQEDNFLHINSDCPNMIEIITGNWPLISFIYLSWRNSPQNGSNRNETLELLSGWTSLVKSTLIGWLPTVSHPLSGIARGSSRKTTIFWRKLRLFLSMWVNHSSDSF